MIKLAGLIATVLVPVALLAQVVALDFSNLYQEASPAVVLVETDEGSGSGFLISEFGHIATNFHVIRNARYLAVQFSDGRKVMAEVVAINDLHDLAVLKVNSALVRDIRPLTLLPADKEDTVQVGMPVAALGSPLNQKFLITQGILSKVAESAVVGDFVLQSGNSGGPLMNVDGEVIGVNTFGEGGLSGAVRIGVLRDLVDSPYLVQTILVQPSTELLPALRDERYPVEVLNLKVQLEDLNWDAYGFRAGEFDVTAITPVLIGKLQAMHEAQALDGNAASGQDGLQFHGGNNPYFEWHRTTETALDYAVTFDIRPRSGLTTGSRLSTFLAPIFMFGQTGTLESEFKAEFLEFRLYRDGELVEPVTPGRQIIEIEYDEDRNRTSDQTYAGIYVYSPEDFMNGNEFRIEIIDAREPNEVHAAMVFTADSPLIQQLRSDFGMPAHFLFAPGP